VRYPCRRIAQVMCLIALILFVDRLCEGILLAFIQIFIWEPLPARSPRPAPVTIEPKAVRAVKNSRIWGSLDGAARPNRRAPEGTVSRTPDVL
jgi:hypothetical protein